MTITEFLIARLDEDESIARAADSASSPPGEAHGEPAVAAPFLPEQQRHIDRWSATRVLVDIAAKRTIVETYEELGRVLAKASDSGRVDEAAVTRNLFAGLQVAVLAHAMVFADHPDYRAEWRS
ncbi:DUF6221 family protein [Promicromonospora sp. NPDC050249]|uniref:DUF6221 family protein n=1 Tax=Promicromonospora sp. NPDC050249 TaxID=3154743 RepID=UPI0033C60C8C